MGTLISPSSPLFLCLYPSILLIPPHPINIHFLLQIEKIVLSFFVLIFYFPLLSSPLLSSSPIYHSLLFPSILTPSILIFFIFFLFRSKINFFSSHSIRMRSSHVRSPYTQKTQYYSHDGDMGQKKKKSCLIKKNKKSDPLVVRRTIKFGKKGEKRQEKEKKKKAPNIHNLFPSPFLQVSHSIHDYRQK
ncbi:hypothetical protein F5X96DRAFT_432189 [Biscogniauxia mediterranea]|nr:hypothetical protein F5X96DRAFT_432189 [Biscogniauxia mediterranea]